MKTYGSQKRETLKKSGYKLNTIEGDKLTGRNAFLISPDGNYELWTERDDYAGYVIEIDGIGYGFVRSLHDKFMLWPCNVCKAQRPNCDTDKQHFPCFVE